jgi:hypothetical protein
MADAVDLDGRLDDLFATPPSEFVKARDALAKDLKGAGLGDEAAVVKALKRPTVAVAALNRAARAEPDAMADLVDVGEQLAALQAARAPDREELRELTRERRTLLNRLTEIAAATTERPEGARASIAATLDSASLDERMRADLLRGRLTQELSPATRFVLGDDAPPATRPAGRKRARQPARSAPPPRDELAARRARAELEAVQERAEAADERAREAADAAREATSDLDAAERRVADLETALADARAALVAAKRADRDAQRADARARTEQERVTAALRAAERAVEDADR